MLATRLFVLPRITLESPKHSIEEEAMPQKHVNEAAEDCRKIPGLSCGKFAVVTPPGALRSLSCRRH